MYSRSFYYTCFYRVSVSYDEIRNRHFFAVKRACEAKAVFDKINVKDVMFIEVKWILETFENHLLKAGKRKIPRVHKSKEGEGKYEKTSD